MNKVLGILGTAAFFAQIGIVDAMPSLLRAALLLSADTAASANSSVENSATPDIIKSQYYYR